MYTYRVEYKVRPGDWLNDWTLIEAKGDMDAWAKAQSRFRDVRAVNLVPQQTERCTCGACIQERQDLRR